MRGSAWETTDGLLVAADEDATPRGMRIWFSGSVGLVGAAVLAFGVSVSGSGTILVSGAVLFVGIVAPLVAARST